MEMNVMSHTIKCPKCFSSFAVPTTALQAPVACPRCAARFNVEKASTASVKPAITDDDVLAFLGSPPQNDR